MPRVKRGTTHVKKRRKLMAKAKGFKWGRKNRIKLAKEAVVKAGAHAYRDRRKKKSNMRALWNIKISAFAKENETSYSRLINSLKNNKIELDRKILADLSENNKKVMAAIVKEVAKK